MISAPNRTTLLLVDDDAAIRQVLGRVLTDDGYAVYVAASLEEALQQAREHPPQVALLDLHLPDGDALQLGRRLHELQPNLPLLLMSGDPVSLQARPELGKQFLRVMTKPMNLEELRRAIRRVLQEAPRPAAPVGAVASAPAMPHGVTVPSVAVPASGNSARPDRFHWLRSAGMVFFALAVLVAFVIYALGIQIPGLSGGETEQKTVGPEASLQVELVKGKTHTILIPDDVLVSLGIRKGNVMLVEPARAPSQMRPLTLSGSTALNPTTLMRIRANFAPTRVVKIGETRDDYDSAREGRTVLRDLRSGDRVSAGTVLAEFYSTDVAAKKSDIVDALVQLHTDQEILRKADSASRSVPDIYIDNARRQVKQDESTIARAKRQLESLGIPEDDILDVYRYAEELLKHGGYGHGPFRLSGPALVTLRTLGMPEVTSRKLAAAGTEVFTTREEFAKQLAALLDRDELDRWQDIIFIHAVQRDPKIEEKWARVVLKATADGVIVERTVNVGETVVDNTVNLFQIARPDRLQVIGNADERDLPELLRLRGKERSWTILTAGAPTSGITAPIEDIGQLIDPNQHSAVVKGYIDNPGGNMRGGQYVSATVQLPPPDDVVEIPIAALIDEGNQAFVFVQTDASQSHYTLQRVKVTHRFEKSAWVKRMFTDVERRLLEKEKGEGTWDFEPLLPGQKVLTRGVLLLKKELLEQEAGE